MIFEDAAGDGAPKPARRAPGWWWYLLGAAAVAVVILSWMVPEPPSTGREPARGVQSSSWTECVAQNYDAPSYGTRSVSEVSGLSNSCRR